MAALVGLAALVVIALIAGITLHNASLRVEVREKQRAAARALKQQRRAEANYLQTRTALKHIVNLVRARYSAGIPQLHELQQQILEDALAYYESSFKEQDDADAGVRFDTAVAYRQAGDLAQLLGRFPQARQRFKAALRLIEQLAEQDPDNARYQEVMLGTLNNLAMIADSPGDESKSEAYLQLARRALLATAGAASTGRHLANQGFLCVFGAGDALRGNRPSRTRDCSMPEVVIFTGSEAWHCRGRPGYPKARCR